MQDCNAGEFLVCRYNLQIPTQSHEVYIPFLERHRGSCHTTTRPVSTLDTCSRSPLLNTIHTKRHSRGLSTSIQDRSCFVPPVFKLHVVKPYLYVANPSHAERHTVLFPLIIQMIRLSSSETLGTQNPLAATAHRRLAERTQHPKDSQHAALLWSLDCSFAQSEGAPCYHTVSSL